MNGRLRLVFVALMLGTMSATTLSQETAVVSLTLSPGGMQAAQGTTVHAVLTATIASPWHINSHTPNDEFLIPAEVTAKGMGIKLASAKYPKPLELRLPFSEKPVSAYEGTVRFEIVLAVEKNTAPGKRDVEVVLDYQACDDKTCLPPTSVSAKFVVEITAAPAETKPLTAVTTGIEVRTDSAGAVAAGAGNPPPSGEPQQAQPPAVAKEKGPSPGVPLALLFAFIGGLILNLMPCVLPVLSLKVMGIVQQAGEGSREKLKHGLLFTFGVLVSFWILAGLLLLLRAGGEQLGWGFQLQSPAFVSVLSVFLFLFGLSMFGVFEIGTSLMSVGQGTQSKSAYAGSFTSGILATVVATPCTAPFMGSALGFALSQPVWVSLLVFTFLGAGMAAPYLLLTLSPGLLKFIPKPGVWMESMKQFMGFLLMATVLWLLWVLSLQTGAEGVVLLLGALLIAGLGGWIIGRWGNVAKPQPVRGIAQGIAILCIAGALVFSLLNIHSQTPSANGVHRQGSIEWQNYSPELVDRLRAERKPVFIDFTAAWCLSCQVNEKVAFGSEDVQKAFAAKRIVAVKADWTNKDDVIGRALASFGRNSVPLYVLYPPGKDAVLLPEILTPQIVLDALEPIRPH
jgi:thiol:disulfide interchange protein